MSFMKKKTVSEVIVDMVSRYHRTPPQINSGDCDIFALSVQEKIPRLKVWQVESNRDHYTLFTLKLAKFSHITGISVKRLESLNMDHVWLYDRNTKKSYDAETPDGVDSPLWLPYFRRKLESAKATALHENPPQLLFHGTSTAQLSKIINCNGFVTDLFLADSKDKASGYAEISSERDCSEPVIMVIKRSKLKGSLSTDYGVDGEEGYDLGQYIFTGDIKNALLKIEDFDGNLLYLTK